MLAKIVSLVNNKEVGEVELSDTIFGLPIRTDILHRAVTWQRARKQQGTHQTKEIWAVSGTTKKPFRQKGTGNARQGSLRSPQFRGGAVIFGPVTRSHAHDLTKKFRKLALKTALSAKAAEGNLKVIDEAKIKETKTSELTKRFKALGGKSFLVIDGNAVDENFRRSISNLSHVDVLPQMAANVMDILRHEQLLITKQGLTELQARLA